MRSGCSPKPAARPRYRRPAVRLVNASHSGSAAVIFALSAAQASRPKRAGRQFAIHAAHVLGDVGQAQAPLRQFGIVFRPELSAA